MPFFKAVSSSGSSRAKPRTPNLTFFKWTFFFYLSLSSGHSLKLCFFCFVHTFVCLLVDWLLVHCFHHLLAYSLVCWFIHSLVYSFICSFIRSLSYYYAALNGSEYSFAFALGDNDKIFRRAQEPEDPTKDVISVFNLLIEYTSDVARYICACVRLSGYVRASMFKCMRASVRKCFEVFHRVLINHSDILDNFKICWQ